MKSRLGVIAVSAILASMIGVSGCSTPGAVSRSNMNTTINVQHGVVTEVKQVDVESNAARNSVLGGLAGLALTSRRSRSSQIAGAAGGALLSGLLTKSAESSQLVNAYTVRLNSGNFVQVVTEQTGARTGDCVAVETGRTSNIRRVSEVLCEPAGSPHRAHQDIREESQEEATECHDAKQQLLNATTEQDVNAIARKVKVLCDY